MDFSVDSWCQKIGELFRKRIHMAVRPGHGFILCYHSNKCPLRICYMIIKPLDIIKDQWNFLTLNTKSLLFLEVIYLIRRKCAFKDVISNKHTDLLIIGPSCTLKWTNPVLFRISEPYLVSCKNFFSFDPIFLHLKLVKKGVIFAWCGQFVKNFPFSPEIIFFYGSGLLPWES